MHLVRRKPKKGRWMGAGLLALGLVAVLGVWAVQARHMIKNVSAEDIRTSTQETKEAFYAGTDFAEDLIDQEAFVPELMQEFQSAATEEVQKQIVLQSAAAAMIEEIESQQDQSE